MTTLVAAPRKDLRSIDDWVEEFHLLADESAMDIAQLQAALMEDLSPRTALEKLIVRDLIDLELERARCRRWIQMCLMENIFAAMLEQAECGGLKGKLKAKEIREYQHIWSGGHLQARQDLLRRLTDLGIDPTTHVLRARMKQSDVIESFEDRIREIEHRRRRLHDDLVRLQQRRRPDIPDAEILRR